MEQWTGGQRDAGRRVVGASQSTSPRAPYPARSRPPRPTASTVAAASRSHAVRPHPLYNDCQPGPAHVAVTQDMTAVRPARSHRRSTRPERTLGSVRRTDRTSDRSISELWYKHSTVRELKPYGCETSTASASAGTVGAGKPPRPSTHCARLVKSRGSACSGVRPHKLLGNYSSSGDTPQGP